MEVKPFQACTNERDSAEKLEEIWSAAGLVIQKHQETSIIFFGFKLLFNL